MRLFLMPLLTLASCQTRNAATPATTSVELTTAALYQEYAADHAGAFTRHENHTLVISGPVWGTTTEPFRIGLEVPDEPFGSILAEMDEAAARAAGLDEAGANARLKCRWLEQNTEAVDISLSRCTVAESPLE